MATVTKPIALDESLNTTELSSRNVADVLAQELSAVATAIGGISAPSAEDVSYDNSGSGLSATDVQNALDEIVSDIPTVNDGTLTIQQNGETKGTFTANQSGNSTVNIETPTTDIQTAVDEFETYNGGLLSSCKVALSPNQDLHGYDSPWVGGAGKNKLPLTVNGIKSANTSGTWSGNEYTIRGITYTIQTDDSGNVIRILINGSNTSGGNAEFNLYTNNSFYLPNGDYILSGGYSNSCRIFYYNGTNYYDSKPNPVSFTVDGTETASRCTAIVTNGTTVNDAVVYPMIRLSTETDPTFESYSNICPITGHTQVEVDVSDGQTTQEQVTVNLGGTYYSGILDIVSGVFVVDRGYILFDGSQSFTTFGTDGQEFRYDISGLKNSIANLISSFLKTVFPYISWNTSGDSISVVGNGSSLGIRLASQVTSATELKAYFAEHPLQVVYELATPQTIQLTPQQVKALVGENHLSAPLEGQEITESKYKQTFTFDDVNAQIESTYSEGISHNSVYRGKYLGDHVTDEQWDAIGDGSFRDLYIGDYWAINGINWRIAHFNYWLGTGDVKCNTNHVVIVPYGWVSTFNMNASDDTTGGYLNSEWYTTNRHFAVENIEADFGASHILSHRNFFSDAVSDGHASHGMWVDSTVDLMNEIMVCGSLVGSYLGKYYEVGCDKFQLALFKYNPPSARMDVSYWLRGVSTASSFVAMGNFGLLDGFTASQILKIRPVFAIKK